MRQRRFAEWLQERHPEYYNEFLKGDGGDLVHSLGAIGGGMAAALPASLALGPGLGIPIGYATTKLISKLWPADGVTKRGKKMKKMKRMRK